MNNKDLITLISVMGCSHEEILRKKIIPEKKLTHLYEDQDTLELEIVPGFELVFYSETFCLEMISFDFGLSEKNDDPRFKDLLPVPLNQFEYQKEVHQTLGDPLFSKTPLELMATHIYAWDIYQLDPTLHPEAILDIQYDKVMKIKTIQISLMAKSF
jgi:hypothetical protein